MGEKSEVIQQEIDDTRSHLADRLEALGGKISGTVEAVEETVEDVAETAEDVVDTVKETFNLAKHTRKHPWLVVGGAVAVGYVGGRLLDSAFSRSRTISQYYPPYPQVPVTQQGNGLHRTPSEPTSHGDGRQEKGWVGSLTDQFGPELNTLKGLALGALFGVARDMIARSLPQALKGEVEDVFDSATERAGGKPIQGRIVEDSDRPEAEAKQTEFAGASSSSQKER